MNQNRPARSWGGRARERGIDGLLLCLLMGSAWGMGSACTGATGDLLTPLINGDAAVDGADMVPTTDIRVPPDQTVPEAPVAPAVCTPWEGTPAFDPPRPLDAVNTSSNESGPFVTHDGLQLFFTSDRPGGSGGRDVYVASRPDPGGEFGAVTIYEGVNTADDDSSLILSGDGLTAYLSSTRPGGEGQADLWIASREDPLAPFAPDAFSPLVEINDGGRQFDPFLSADGRRLYLTTDGVIESGSLADLAVAKRSIPTGLFGAPLAVLGLDTEGVHDGNPALSADQLLIVFSSNRSGGPGSPDLWYATRPSPDTAFLEPRLLDTLNTADPEGEIFITPDGCEIYFGRRIGEQWDLYVARLSSKTGNG